MLRTFIAGAGSGALLLATALFLGATVPELTAVIASTIVQVAIAVMVGTRRTCF
ncbi:MAG: hypothetical protein AB4040_17990 [Synechococcus sp.]